MADDQLQALLASRSLLDCSQGAGGKGLPLLAGILPGGARDIDCFKGLTIKERGLCDKPLPTIATAAKPGLLMSLVMQLKSDGVWSALQKVAQAAPVTSCSINDIAGSNLPSGSSGIGPQQGGSGFDNGI